MARRRAFHGSIFTFTAARLLLIYEANSARARWWLTHQAVQRFHCVHEDSTPKRAFVYGIDDFMTPEMALALDSKAHEYLDSCPIQFSSPRSPEASIVYCC